jgi:hypothetical protein
MLYTNVISKKVRYSVHLKQGRSRASKCQSHHTAITDNNASLPLASILTPQQWHKYTFWIPVSVKLYTSGISAASSKRWQCQETCPTNLQNIYNTSKSYFNP